jgi:hypothetical protein
MVDREVLALARAGWRARERDEDFRFDPWPIDEPPPPLIASRATMLEAAGALDAAADAVANQDLRKRMRAAALGLLPPLELTTDRDTILDTAELLNNAFDVIADRDLRKRIRAVVDALFDIHPEDRVFHALLIDAFADEMTEPVPFSMMLWGRPTPEQLKVVYDRALTEAFLRERSRPWPEPAGTILDASRWPQGRRSTVRSGRIEQVRRCYGPCAPWRAKTQAGRL